MCVVKPRFDERTWSGTPVLPRAFDSQASAACSPSGLPWAVYLAASRRRSVPASKAGRFAGSLVPEEIGHTLRARSG
jgi:hypothetical protein